MLLIRVLLGVIGLLLTVGASIYRKIVYSRRQKMHQAAFDILKEEALTAALENPMKKEKKEEQLYNLEDKIMIQLASDIQKSNMNYVFNPEKPITFGRNPKTSDVCLRDSVVSGSHCMIFTNNGKVWIKDLGSSNGTIVRRKEKNCRLKKEEAIELKNKDMILVGESSFHVCLFRLNRRYL